MPMPKEMCIMTPQEVANLTPEEQKQRDIQLTNLKALPLESLAKLLEAGMLDINDDQLLFTIEKSINRRIKPLNPMRPETTIQARIAAKKAGTTTVEGKQMKVAKTDQLEWMDKQLSAEERYKVAVEQKDKRISASEVLQKASFSMMMENNYKEWCTPELFDYLSMNGEKAIEELRAVAYPLMVSFNQESYLSDDKTWVVPYITFSYETGEKNNGAEMADSGYGQTFSFYLNNKREVQIMRGKIVETYYEHDFGSKTELLNYVADRRNILDKQNRTQTKKAYFLNIKLAKGLHAIIENRGTEGNLERRKGVPLSQTYKWSQVYDMTNCNGKNGKISPAVYWATKFSSEARQRIDEKGRKAMEALDKLVFDTSRYVYRSGWYEGEFSECYGAETTETPFLQ